jgi:alpha-galactosidase
MVHVNMFTLDILVPLLATLPLAQGLVRPDGVGKVPALGWNSWNAFHCNITESDFLTAANQIVSLGLKVRLPFLPSSHVAD